MGFGGADIKFLPNLEGGLFIDHRSRQVTRLFALLGQCPKNRAYMLDFVGNFYSPYIKIGDGSVCGNEGHYAKLAQTSLRLPHFPRMQYPITEMKEGLIGD